MDYVQAYAWTSLAIARGIDYDAVFRDEITANCGRFPNRAYWLSSS